MRLRAFRFAGLLVLILASDVRGEETAPSITNFQITDCEGNFLSDTLTTSTATTSVRINAADPGNGLRFGIQPHLGGAAGTSANVLLLHLNGVFTDDTIHGNNGADTGTAASASVPDPSFSASRTWDADGDRIQVNKSASLNSTTAQMTLEAWINPTSVATSRPIFQWFQAAPSASGVSMGHASNLFTTLITTEGASHTLASPAGIITAGQWQLVAMTWDGGTARLYRNDVLVASKTFGPLEPLQTSYNLFIGQNPPAAGISFRGEIDEVRIASRALSSIAIANDYHGGILDYTILGSTPIPTRLLLSTNTGGHYTPTNPAQGATTVTTATVTALKLTNGGNASLAFSFQDRGGATSQLLQTITIDVRKPEPPQALTATSVGATSLRYDWAKPTRLCLRAAGLPGQRPGEYNLYDENDVLLTPNIAALTQTRLGLGVNTLNGARVAAVDDYGESTHSGSVFAYTLANLPTGAAAQSVSTGSMVLDWSENGNPNYTRYDVTFFSDASFTTQTANPVQITDNHVTSSAALTGLSPQTTYYIRIRARNGRFGDGELGSQFTSGLDATIPTRASPPGSLSVTALGPSSVTWTWSAVPTAQSYTLDSSSGGVLAITSGLSHTVTGLTANQSVGARLAATNNSATSEFGPTVFAFTSVNIPLSPVLAAASTSTLTFSWNPNNNPPATAYEAQLSSASGFTGNITTENTAATAIVFSRLLPGTTHYMRVRARNGDSTPTEFTSAVQGVTVSVGPTSSTSTPTTPYAPRTGTVALFHFDESSGTFVNDSSGNGNHGALSCTFASCSTPTFSAAQTGLGTAANFTGIQNTLCRIPHKASLNTTGDLTVEAWVRPDTTLQIPQAGIIAKGSGTFESYAIDVFNNRWRFLVRNGGFGTAFTVQSTQALVSERWTHVAGVYVSGGAPSLRLYIDGVLSSSTTAAPSSRGIDTHELTIGSRQSASSDYNLGFRGLIDEVHVLTTALSAGEVRDDYNSGSPTPVSMPFPNEGTTVTIPPNAFNGAATILISSDPVGNGILVNAQVLSDGLSAPPTGQTLVPGSVIELIAKVGGLPFTANFASSITITVAYPDADANTLVDGTSPPLPARNLKMYTLDTSVVRWIALPTTVDLANRRVSALTPHFSVFALFGPSGVQSTVDSVRVYPVPWKPGGGGRFDSVTFAGKTGLAFDNLSTAGTIGIFTLSGESIVTLEFSSFNAGTFIWDGKNRGGHPVASGVYFAFVKSSTGSQAVLKFAVER